MKTPTQTTGGSESFRALPEDYAGLCRRYVPRPLHDAADYAAAVRSPGAKLLRGERRLKVGHTRTLARHFNVEPGVLV